MRYLRRMFYRMYYGSVLRREIKWFFHIMFGMFYEKATLYSKGRCLYNYYDKNKRMLGKRVRYFRWFLGRPTIVQDSLLGTYMQIASRFEGFWEYAEIDDFFGVGWQFSEQLIEFDLLRLRQRKIEFANENGTLWYKPKSSWFKCGVLKPRKGTFRPYDDDFWWEVDKEGVHKYSLDEAYQILKKSLQKHDD